MNELVNKFLLAGDEFLWISAMHLKQPGFSYSACNSFTKNKNRTQKFIQTGNTNLFKYSIYKNDFDKIGFQHEMAYDKYKDFTKGTQSYKVLKHKAFKIANNLEYDESQRGLPSMVFKFFDKKSAGSYIKGAYIKYVGGGPEGFTNFSEDFS